VCRRKKVRCGGEQPACQNCIKVGAACAYKSSEAVAASLLSELQKSQSRIRGLEDNIRKLSLLGGDDRNQLIVELATELSSQSNTASNTNTKPSPSDAVTSPASFGEGSSEELPKQGVLEEAEISVDEHGEVSLGSERLKPREANLLSCTLPMPVPFAPARGLQRDLDRYVA
jgi:Ni,Fe-hydrogenase I large subunit